MKFRARFLRGGKFCEIPKMGYFGTMEGLDGLKGVQRVLLISEIFFNIKILSLDILLKNCYKNLKNFLKIKNLKKIIFQPP